MSTIGSGPIRLVISDIDGTLVTHDKRLADATVAAVKRLGAAGIGFTVTSSRPPIGLAPIVAALDIKLPVGAFNGGALVNPDGSVLAERFIPEDVAREAVRFLAAEGVSVWVFSGRDWLITDPSGDHVDRERHTIQAEPVVVPEFGGALARAGKIVGVSRNHDLLARCESEMLARLGGAASVARSQAYYLDITPDGVSKGTFLTEMSRRTGIAPAAIAAFGDMDNDVPMLALAGLPIAVGNASPAARAAARLVTRSNEEDGVAYGIDAFILGPDRRD